MISRCGIYKCCVVLMSIFIATTTIHYNLKQEYEQKTTDYEQKDIQERLLTTDDTIRKYTDTIRKFKNAAPKSYVARSCKMEQVISNTNMGYCANLLRFGLDEAFGHNGHQFCVTSLLKTKSSGSCVAYSFGINNDFTVDDQLAEHFNCTVLSFDPSMKQGVHTRSNGVQFYPIGIGSNNSNSTPANGLACMKEPCPPAEVWPTRTLGSLMTEHNHTHLNIIKMDVEIAEWKFLEYLMDNPKLVSGIEQLALEIHYPASPISYVEYCSTWTRFTRTFPQFRVVAMDFWKRPMKQNDVECHLVTLLNYDFVNVI